MIAVNIFMAALLNPSGAPAKIRQRWRQQQFEVLVSAPISTEYANVLFYAPTLSALDVILLLTELRAFARQVEISGTLRVCKDPDDDKFLETAVTGGADFLVTKNLKHFPHKSFEGVRIVNVSTLLKELKKIFPV